MPGDYKWMLPVANSIVVVIARRVRVEGRNPDLSNGNLLLFAERLKNNEAGIALNASLSQTSTSLVAGF